MGTKKIKFTWKIQFNVQDTFKIIFVLMGENTIIIKTHYEKLRRTKQSGMIKKIII